MLDISWEVVGHVFIGFASSGPEQKRPKTCYGARCPSMFRFITKLIKPNLGFFSKMAKLARKDDSEAMWASRHLGCGAGDLWRSLRNRENLIKGTNTFVFIMFLIIRVCLLMIGSNLLISIQNGCEYDLSN